MKSSPDQNNKLGMLDSDDGSTSFILFKIFQGVDCNIRVFWSFGAWITHGCTPQKYRAAVTIFM